MRTAASLTVEIRFRGSKLDVRRVDMLAKRLEMKKSALLRRLVAEAFRAQGLKD